MWTRAEIDNVNVEGYLTHRRPDTIITWMVFSPFFAAILFMGLAGICILVNIPYPLHISAVVGLLVAPYLFVRFDPDTRAAVLLPRTPSGKKLMAAYKKLGRLRTAYYNHEMSDIEFAQESGRLVADMEYFFVAACEEARIIRRSPTHL